MGWRINRWLATLALALFIDAWLLWLALAPWLRSSLARARAWFSPSLKRLHVSAAFWADRADAWWRAMLRGAASALARATRWLVVRGAVIRHALGPILAVARAARAVRLATVNRGESDNDLEFAQEDLGASEAGTELAQPQAGDAFPWVPRLSRCARVGRAALIVGSVGLALFVVVGGPSSLFDALQQWASSLAAPAVNAAPRPRLNASFWVGRRVPSPAVFVRGINLAPSAADSDLAYVCWVDHHPAGNATPSVNLYLTADGARSWQSLSVPAGEASSCRAIPDAADPQRLLLLLASPPSDGACAAPRIYDSADRGTTWVPVAPPDALATACDLSLYQWRDAIYAWSPSAQAQPGGGLVSQLLASEDDGGSWQPVAGPTLANAAISLVATRADGAMLVLASASSAHDTLWCRATPTAPWQSLGALPAGTSTAYAADGQRTGSGCAWGTLYAAGHAIGEDPTITRLDVMDGHGWNILPPLPISDTAAGHPLTVDGHVLTVGPDGLLLVDSIYTGPGLGITTGTSSPAHTFWGWDPRAKRWLTDIHISPANSSIDGFVWDYSQPVTPRLICWVYTLNAGIPAYTGLYRASFAAPAAPAQDGGDQRASGL